MQKQMQTGGTPGICWNKLEGYSIWDGLWHPSTYGLLSQLTHIPWNHTLLWTVSHLTSELWQVHRQPLSLTFKQLLLPLLTDHIVMSQGSYLRGHEFPQEREQGLSSLRSHIYSGLPTRRTLVVGVICEEQSSNHIPLTWFTLPFLPIHSNTVLMCVVGRGGS